MPVLLAMPPAAVPVGLAMVMPMPGLSSGALGLSSGALVAVAMACLMISVLGGMAPSLLSAA